MEIKLATKRLCCNRSSKQKMETLKNKQIPDIGKWTSENKRWNV